MKGLADKKDIIKIPFFKFSKRKIEVINIENVENLSNLVDE